MKTIVWHLKEQGIFLDSRKEIDVRLFYQHLEAIIGNVADVVMNEIYDNLRRTSHDNLLQISPDAPVVERIAQLLEVSDDKGAK